MTIFYPPVPVQVFSLVQVLGTGFTMGARAPGEGMITALDLVLAKKNFGKRMKPRATCPICGRNLILRKDYSFPRHQLWFTFPVSIGGGYFQFRRKSKMCYGSHRLVKDFGLNDDQAA